MTAAEAAVARGKTQTAAFQWATKAGVKWRSAKPIAAAKAARQHIGPTARQIIAAMLIRTRADAAEWTLDELTKRLNVGSYGDIRDGIADAELRKWIKRGRIGSGKTEFRTYQLTADGMAAARAALEEKK